MKKNIKYTFVSLIILLCMVIFYLFRPMWGYLGWETLLENLNSFYINLSPDRVLNQNVTSLLQYINSDPNLRNNYKKAFSWAENDDGFIWRTYRFWLFNGFIPLKIENKCFIFKADINVINESVWGKISKYKKESPTSTSECKSNCSVYFTEKWLLTKDDVYYCQ